jgi:hypothetical protein
VVEVSPSSSSATAEPSWAGILCAKAASADASADMEGGEEVSTEGPQDIRPL